MKRLFLLASVVFAAFSLFASSQVVLEDYTFSISGKTMEYSVRQLVAGDEGRVFGSEEELSAALDEKVQTLNNKRVFKSVDCSYTMEGDKAHVEFTLDSARSILVIPFPKYDSNYGTRIGIKYFDSNVFGTVSNLSGTLNLTFPDGAWDDPSLGFDIDYHDMVFPNGTGLTVRGMVEGNRSDIQKYDLSVGVSDIPLFVMDFSTTTRIRSLDEGELLKHSSSFGGLEVMGHSFTPSIELEDYTAKAKKSFITPSLKASGFRLGKIDASFTGSYTARKNVSAGEDFYTSNMVSFASDLTWDGTHSLNNTYQHYLWGEEASRNRFLNEFDLVLNQDSTLVVKGNLYMDDRFAPSYLDGGVGVKQKIVIGKYVEFTPMLVEYLRYYFPAELGQEGIFGHFYTLSAVAGGNFVNWKGNFREGVRYNIALEESWMQYYSSREIMDGVFDHLEVEVHKILWKYLNPSARVIVNYANNGIDDDNDYNYILFDQESTLGEYLRGVRNNAVTDRNMFASVVNMNLLSYFPMPSIFSFVDCYANLFFDYGCVKETETADVKNYYAAGLEGIGILKEYPSYPVRVSLGCDLAKLKAYMDGTGARDFYEIFIGLGFFF